MHPHINPHLQKKARMYEKSRDTLSLLRVSISASYLSGFYFSGLSRLLSSFAAGYHLALAVLVYMTLFTLPLLLLLFPLSYRAYTIEKRFGLSSQTVRSWLFDELKGLLLGGILGYPLFLLLFFLFQRFPGFWWFFGALGLSAFQILITAIFPVLLLPLFFKQAPIEDPHLVARIKELFRKAGVHIKGIYSFDLSSKTKKENAALTGFLKTRRVLLGDTLLKNRSSREVVVVLAHEIAHHLKRHVLKLSSLNLLASFLLFFSISRIMGMFPGFPQNLERSLDLLPLFLLLLAVLSFFMRIGMNAYTRLKEREADRLALSLTGDKDAFIRLMVGLAHSNLAIAYPKGIKVLLFYSHPPVGKRIEFAKRYN